MSKNQIFARKIRDYYTSVEGQLQQAIEEAALKGKEEIKTKKFILPFIKTRKIISELQEKSYDNNCGSH